jgi:peptidyl-prolyl cis-trans isomerase B (cyclophilin B)
MNRKILLLLAIILAVGGWLYLNRDKSKQLPTGDVSQDLSPDKLVSSITPAPLTGRPQVEISTSKGSFIIELRPDLAQQSVVNFLSKWSNQACNGLTFHRVEDWVVQGCDPSGNGTGGRLTLITETSSESFVAGSVGVARQLFPQEYSNDSQFFIVKKDAAYLNGQYTYLGKVVSGFNVVDRLSIGDKIIATTILSK